MRSSIHGYVHTIVVLLVLPGYTQINIAHTRLLLLVKKCEARFAVMYTQVHTIVGLLVVSGYTQINIAHATLLLLMHKCEARFMVMYTQMLFYLFHQSTHRSALRIVIKRRMTIVF